MRCKAILVGGLLMVAVSAAPASAVPIFGQLTLVGSATVSATLIDWLPGGTQAPEGGEGNFLTTNPGEGYFATIDVPSLVNSGDTIDLAAPGVFPVANFLHGFVTTDPRYSDLSFTLQGLVIPGLPVCNGSEGQGDSCVAFAGSPFQLTVLPGGDTGVLFNVFGFFLDPTEGSDHFLNFATGSYTATLDDRTPNQVRLTIIGGGNVTAGYDGQFNATVIPEPVSLTLLGTGLLGLAVRARHKKR